MKVAMPLAKNVLAPLAPYYVLAPYFIKSSK